jgi:hypothetical protein
MVLLMVAARMGRAVMINEISLPEWKNQAGIARRLCGRRQMLTEVRGTSTGRGQCLLYHPLSSTSQPRTDLQTIPLFRTIVMTNEIWQMAKVQQAVTNPDRTARH